MSSRRCLTITSTKVSKIKHPINQCWQSYDHLPHPATDFKNLYHGSGLNCIGGRLKNGAVKTECHRLI